jgi:hypothetical protein
MFSTIGHRNEFVNIKTNKHTSKSWQSSLFYRRIRSGSV